MSYNRWMPGKYYNSGELYHYGVKGMKWRHRKSLQIEAQEATTGGGQELDENGKPIVYDESKVRSEDEQADAAYKKYQEWQESQKPAWQKKWEHSDTKKTLDSIIAKIKSRGPKKKARKPKKSNLKIEFK